MKQPLDQGEGLHSEFFDAAAVELVGQGGYLPFRPFAVTVPCDEDAAVLGGGHLLPVGEELLPKLFTGADAGKPDFDVFTRLQAGEANCLGTPLPPPC